MHIPEEGPSYHYRYEVNHQAPGLVCTCRSTASLSEAADGWYEEWRVTECLRSRILSLSPALFESVNEFRPTTKSSLADSLWCSEAAILPGPSETVQQYVLYGGALYHRVSWTREATKDCAHMRRSGGTIGVTVHFTSSMAFQTKKEEFLSNKHNKQRFISLLSQRLEQAGCEIHQASGNTDVLIVQTALTSAAKQETVQVKGTIQICLCSSSTMQRTSGITSSSDLKLDGRVRREIDAGTSMQFEPFLEVVSLTTLCSCMPFMGRLPRLVFTVWSRNYKYQRSNLTISSKIRLRFS